MQSFLGKIHKPETLHQEIGSLYWMTLDEIRRYPNVPPWLVSSIEQGELVLGLKKR